MDDYLTEKEQWERVTRWLRENGLWILAGVAVGALAIFGWQWWNAHIDKVNGEASAKFEHGDAMIDVGLVQRGARWQVLGFFVKSDQLLK